MEEKTISFTTKDNNTYTPSINILKMTNLKLTPETNSIILNNITSTTFSNFIKYCEGHNYEPYNEEIPRPLNDNLQMCINNQFDFQFINEMNFDEVINLMLLAEQFGNAGLQDLCLCKLALYIRNTKLEELMQKLNINGSEFNEDIVNKIICDNGNLMMIDDDRVKEFLNDDL